jgi:hypothetical protein
MPMGSGGWCGHTAARTPGRAARVARVARVASSQASWSSRGARRARLLATGNDADNRAAVRAVPRDALDLVGPAVYGPRNAVDKMLRGARLHP